MKLDFFAGTAKVFFCDISNFESKLAIRKLLLFLFKEDQVSPSDFGVSGTMYGSLVKPPSFGGAAGGSSGFEKPAEKSLLLPFPAAAGIFLAGAGSAVSSGTSV